MGNIKPFRGYRTPPVNTSIPGEPRPVNVMLPYDLWLKLDAIARKENKSRASLVKPFVVDAVKKICSHRVSTKSDARHGQPV